VIVALAMFAAASELAFGRRWLHASGVMADVAREHFRVWECAGTARADAAACRGAHAPTAMRDVEARHIRLVLRMDSHRHRHGGSLDVLVLPRPGAPMLPVLVVSLGPFSKLALPEQRHRDHHPGWFQAG